VAGGGARELPWPWSRLGGRGDPPPVVEVAL
jgi:hypothetical protein